MTRRLLFILLLLASCYEACAAFHVPTKEGTTTVPSKVGHPHSQFSVVASQPKSGSRKNLPAKHLRMTKEEEEDGTSNIESGDDASWLWIPTLVLPLQLVYISNQWSRSSLYYLVNFSDGADPFRAMNLDIGFSQAQYGLLASLAFTTLFAVASLGAGIASDQYNRKQLTVAATIGWSLATLGTAFSGDYTQVLVCRVLMGLACAFATPTAYTLINDRVPKDRTSLATSIYGTGGRWI